MDDYRKILKLKSVNASLFKLLFQAFSLKFKLYSKFFTSGSLSHAGNYYETAQK